MWVGLAGPRLRVDLQMDACHDLVLGSAIPFEQVPVSSKSKSMIPPLRDIDNEGQFYKNLLILNIIWRMSSMLRRKILNLQNFPAKLADINSYLTNEKYHKQ